MLSVVVPVLNCEDLIEVQLEALARQDYTGDWEVLVVDNGSTDGTVEVAKAYADRLPNLRIIDASSRRGVSHARNCGARAADGDVILICDADDRVRPTWVRKMAEASRSLDIIGGYLDTRALNDVETRSWRNPFAPTALPTGMLNHLPFAVGANVGVTRACFEAIDGWREEYICGGDDVDFSWRGPPGGGRPGGGPGGGGGTPGPARVRRRPPPISGSGGGHRLPVPDRSQRALPPVRRLRAGRSPRLRQPPGPRDAGQRPAPGAPGLAAGDRPIAAGLHHPAPARPLDPQLRVPLGPFAGEHPPPLPVPLSRHRKFGPFSAGALPIAPEAARLSVLAPLVRSR